MGIDIAVNGNNQKNVISFPLDGKTILWLAEINKYIVAEPPADEVIQLIWEGQDTRFVISYCKTRFGMAEEQAEAFVFNIRQYLAEYLHPCVLPGNLLTNKKLTQFNPSNASKKYYRIFGFIFFVEYETEQVETLIHSKFEHMEVGSVENPDHHFQVFCSHKICSLRVDGEQVGIWEASDSHFLAGKFSMQILQKIYRQEEDGWMAVFHAAGITDGKNSLMFLGDSGNGKSTLSAILMASGFVVLADDFLPVESKTAQLCVFPAAISVKKSAIDLLITQFPELKHTTDYSYPAFNKTVRYLSNPYSATGIPKKAPCKALVFVKFEANSGLQFSSLPKDIAFQKLVPDSWISPLETNARCFLDWFDRLPCYQLTYSNNEAMVRTVKNLFEDEI